MVEHGFESRLHFVSFVEQMTERNSCSSGAWAPSKYCYQEKQTLTWCAWGKLWGELISVKTLDAKVETSVMMVRSAVVGVC